MKEFDYRMASLEDLNKIWDDDIKKHPNDQKYIRLKKQYIEDNINNKCRIFVIAYEKELIGQGTLLLSSECYSVKGRPLLCDDKNIGNINALRIDKKYEGQGHISKLVKEIERYAKGIGLTYLTIGVEAKESRNLGIYLHWGYNEFVIHEIDEKENALVLYYGKKI